MSTTSFYLILGIMVFLSIISSALNKKTKKRKKNTNASKRPQSSNVRTSNEVRPDHVILSSHLDDLTWGEFERLLAMYFRDQGYTVEETGTKVREGSIGDGGVDLVIVDRKGERTAVQAKHWSGNVGAEKIRAFNSAKRNYNCILALLITSADLTRQAKEQAEMLKVEYWHGATLERKLEKWGKWKPAKNNIRKQSSYSQVAAASEESNICTCGAPMVKRRNKQGQYFLGCSRFPECKHTRSI